MIDRIASFFVVPWTAFVAAFLYYVVLTLVAIGVEQLPDGLMVAAYLIPPAAYVLVLLARTLQAVASLPVRLAHPAPALQR